MTDQIATGVVFGAILGVVETAKWLMRPRGEVNGVRGLAEELREHHREARGVAEELLVRDTHGLPLIYRDVSVAARQIELLTEIRDALKRRP